MKITCNIKALLLKIYIYLDKWIYDFGQLHLF